MITTINAGPGTGKTFTLVQSFRHLTNTVITPHVYTEEQEDIIEYVLENWNARAKIGLFAYNESAKEKFKRLVKKTQADVYTLHGLGRSVLTRKFGFQEVDTNRTDRHIEAMIGTSPREMRPQDRKYWYGVKQVVGYLKMENLPVTKMALQYIKEKYPSLSEFDIEEDCLADLSALLERAAVPDNTIDHNDMVWQAIRHAKPRYTLGLVDESQDISAATYQLIASMCESVIFCGDKNQAIYAFNGASESMYDSIASKSEAILPLKQSRRCPITHCEFANSLKPDSVSPMPDAEPGSLTTTGFNTMPLKNPETTLLLARTNATLISAALILLSKQIPVTLPNKDLKKRILGFLKSLGSTSSEIERGVHNWLNWKRRLRNEFHRKLAMDMGYTILALIKDCSNLEEVHAKIDSLFQDRVRGFPLRTAHSAKGLEAENIFILGHPIPLNFPDAGPIMLEQETNLDYVARTRSSKNLYLVE